MGRTCGKIGRYPESGGKREARKTETAMGGLVKRDLERVEGVEQFTNGH